MSRLDINDMREIAQLKGGKCLSKEYINSFEPLKWMCEKGHTWDAPYIIIRQGGWCRQCARDDGRKEYYLEQYKKFAEKKGGKCLSEKYINTETKLKWECDKGHRWDAPPERIKSGSWCAVCAAEKRKLTLHDMQAIAASRNGKCLSLKYINSNTKLKWQCDQNHIWMSTPGIVKNSNSWCPYCAHNVILTIDKMQELAKQRGGKCLSAKYTNAYTKLKWKCSKGHVWEAKPYSIKNNNRWCPVCSGNVVTAGQIKHLEANRGYHLVSKYTTSKDLLKWRCKNGHIFYKSYNGLKFRGICSVCKQEARMKKINFMLKKQGGKMLSKLTKDRIKIKLQCKKGHIWETKPPSIMNGHWCPVCAPANKFKNTKAGFLLHQ